jgi:inosose dehydratase
VLADDCGRGEPLDWSRFAGAVSRAAARARERGYEPAFHHHLGTRIETPDEIERLLELVDVPLLLDSGHLLAGGGDPAEALRRWRERVDYVHVKDVRLDLLRSGGSWEDAWRDGLFCELGAGDLDLAAFLAELDGYGGWIVVEQDWVARPGDDPAVQIEAQARNRRVLAQALDL